MARRGCRWPRGYNYREMLRELLWRGSQESLALTLRRAVSSACGVSMECQDVKLFRWSPPVTAFFVAAALIGAPSASAVPLSNEFFVTQVGSSFLAINNSANWRIYGFEVAQPAGAILPTTSRLGWTATACPSGCGLSSPSFRYWVPNGVNGWGLGIAGGTWSNQFGFSGNGFSNTIGGFPDGTSNTILVGETPPVGSTGNIFDGTSNTILFGETPAGGGIPDGTSNTILIGESFDYIVYVVSNINSITDGTSNTILFGEEGSGTAKFGFRYRHIYTPPGGISDGSSNTIFLGENNLSDVPVPGALPLMASVLAGGLVAARLRKRRKTQQ